jgi:hypothetical protein
MRPLDRTSVGRFMGLWGWVFVRLAVYCSAADVVPVGGQGQGMVEDKGGDEFDVELLLLLLVAGEVVKVKETYTGDFCFSFLNVSVSISIGASAECEEEEEGISYTRKFDLARVCIDLSHTHFASTLRTHLPFIHPYFTHFTLQ